VKVQSYLHYIRLQNCHQTDILTGSITGLACLFVSLCDLQAPNSRTDDSVNVL